MSKTLIGLSILLSSWFSAHAEQYVDTGDYIIHYNALSTEVLAPQVTRAYGITRSKNRAMLSITVMKKDDSMNVAVEADVSATATNLNGQLRSLDMRLIEEQDARYYVGFVRVSNEETLNFKAQILPQGVKEPIEVSFAQQFFTE